jgi:hypothetical protein
MHEKGSKIKIINPIEDPNYIDKQIYTARLHNNPSELIIKIVPFNKYED